MPPQNRRKRTISFGGPRPLISRATRNAMSRQAMTGTAKGFSRPNQNQINPARQAQQFRPARAQGNFLLQAGKILNEFFRGQLGNKHQTQAMADVLGGQRNQLALQNTRRQPELLRRGMAEEKEVRLAFEQLQRFPKHLQKVPPTEALKELKAFFLEQLFDPQGEIKSFTAMREFLKERGICANEGNFQTVFGHMFSKDEQVQLQRIFQEPFDNPQARTIWPLQQQHSRQKKAA